VKIIRLEAEAFKRLVAVSIKPDGSLVTVTGRNGMGKTSVLDSIAAALGGAKAAPKDPVRHGAKKAQIVVETDELVVTRTFTAKGGTALEVTAKNGAKVAKPQQLLDSLVGEISFDPLAFLRMKSAEQAQLLRQLVGLDMTAENEKRKVAYDKRTDIGREIRRLQGALEKLPEAPAGTPAEVVSVAALTIELDRRREVNAAHAAKRAELDGLRVKATALRENIAALERELEEQRAEFARLSEAGKALSAVVKALADEGLEEVRSKIATAEQTNAAVRARQEREKLQGELDTQVNESERLTVYIEQIDQVKAEAAATAKYPIDGLVITDDGVELGGVPFEQASQAQQLRTSVAIGLAMNPKLKVLLVRDGSLLDEDNLRLVAELADKAGGQVWLERVGTGKGATVLIEDGQVAPAPTGEDASEMNR